MIKAEDDASESFGDSEFENAAVDELKALPDKSADDPDGPKIAARLRAAKAKKAEQENDLRDRFFLWTFILASVIIGGNFVLVGYYAYSLHGQVPPQVMMFWISSTVVQILGIVYIIAQYLFPKSPDQKKKKDNRQAHPER